MQTPWRISSDRSATKEKSNMGRKYVPQTFSTRVELYNKRGVKAQVGKDKNFCYSKAHFSFCSRIRHKWFSLNVWTQ